MKTWQKIKFLIFFRRKKFQKNFRKLDFGDEICRYFRVLRYITWYCSIWNYVFAIISENMCLIKMKFGRNIPCTKVLKWYKVDKNIWKIKIFFWMKIFENIFILESFKTSNLRSLGENRTFLRWIFLELSIFLYMGILRCLLALEPLFIMRSVWNYTQLCVIKNHNYGWKNHCSILNSFS